MDPFSIAWCCVLSSSVNRLRSDLLTVLTDDLEIKCLNEHWFSDIFHARKTINDWRQDYKKCSPHSSLDYQIPAKFAADWRNGNMKKTMTLTRNPAPFRNRIPA
jgi:transposase InsO family protein